MNQQVIEFIALDALTQHPQNSRVHSPEQVGQIAASIERFGFRGCILIDESGVILAGHGRALAMRKLGRDTIPCQRVTGLTDLEKRAYVIADNQIAQNSEWDEAILAAEVDYLMAGGIELADLGISPAALATVADHAPASIDDIRALEEKTDHAATDEAAFQRELSRADTAGLLPIVPMYAEHHQAIIILIDNSIDEAWLRNRLGLDTKHGNEKGTASFLPNVLTVPQFRERLGL